MSSKAKSISWDFPFNLQLWVVSFSNRPVTAATAAATAVAPSHVTPAPAVATTPRAQALHAAVAAQRVVAQSSLQQAAAPRARNQNYSIVNPRAHVQTTVTSTRTENSLPNARVQAVPSGSANMIVVVPRAGTGGQNAGPSAREQVPAPNVRARELQAAAALVAQQAAATILRTTIVVSR